MRFKFLKSQTIDNAGTANRINKASYLTRSRINIQARNRVTSAMNFTCKYIACILDIKSFDIVTNKSDGLKSTPVIINLFVFRGRGVNVIS